MTVFVPIGRGREAIIDDCDADLVLKHQWDHREHTEHCVYAFRRGVVGEDSRRILMHREILGVPRGILVDHIDGNGLNNRRSNLRSCSHAENMRNRRQRGVFSFPYKGISEHSGMFRARIKVDGKRFISSGYPTPERAARAYDVLALKHHGAFACLNFPGEPAQNDILDHLAIKQRIMPDPDDLGRQYVGVYREKEDQHFRIEIMVDGKRIRIRGFKTSLEAAQAYDDLVIKHRGASGRLNFPNRARAA